MLKASCPQGALHDILQVVSRGVSGRSTQPVQNNIYVETSENQLRLVATDLEYISLDASVPAMVMEEGSVTVPGRIFNEIVASLAAEDVSLEAEQEGQMTIHCGQSRYQVRGLPAGDFQMLPEVVPAAEFSLPEADLHLLLEQTVFACSPDETRPILTGALFDLQPEMLTVVGTDTYRLALRHLKCDTGVEQEQKMIVSARVLGELMRILDAEGDDPVTIRFSERLVEFEIRNVKVASRLIEGEFPNYEKVIPDQQDKRLLVQIAALEQALRRAMIVARDDANRVVLRGEGSTLQISAASPDVGSVEEKVEMELEGEPVEIAFNVRYMLDMLETAGSEQVVMNLSGALNPGTVRPAGREDYIYVLMPMQIMT